MEVSEIEYDIMKILAEKGSATCHDIRKEFGSDRPNSRAIGNICRYSQHITYEGFDGPRGNRKIWTLKDTLSMDDFEPDSAASTLQIIMRAHPIQKDKVHIQRSLALIDRYRDLPHVPEKILKEIGTTKVE